MKKRELLVVKYLCRKRLAKKLSEAKQGKYVGKNNPNFGNHKLAGKNHPNYGKPMSEEQKKKQSKSMKGKMAGENNPKARKVIRLCDNKLYDYAIEAAQDNGICVDTLRSRCKRHKEFMYYDEWLTQQND